MVYMTHQGIESCCRHNCIENMGMKVIKRDTKREQFTNEL